MSDDRVPEESSRVELELNDIQSGVLRPRPSPYAATFIVLRIDEPRAGHELMRRAGTAVASVADTASPVSGTWLSIALSYRGLEALGVPRASLDSFAPEFRQGMAARANLLGDTGESSPENWEKPLGTPEVHVVFTAVSSDAEQLELALASAYTTYQQLPGITMVWRQDCHTRADGREAFGFRDGISHPAVEGTGIQGTNPQEQPLKAGEFVLGYPNESGVIPSMPRPELLGRNGSYAAFRKLHQRVAAFRQFLRAGASCPDDQELLAAKLMGRWRSGAPLALCPVHDDPELGADPRRNNDFLYAADDPIGYMTPRGSHIRRANPRDGTAPGVVRLHRMIRRGASYGPDFQEGLLEDDGAERGLMFTFIGASLRRQFEFVQSEWLNHGTFIEAGDAKDPIAGSNDGAGTFDVPLRPIRKRFSGLTRFVITRGGEYCFVPGLRALRWLSELDT